MKLKKLMLAALFCLGFLWGTAAANNVSGHKYRRYGEK